MTSLLLEMAPKEEGVVAAVPLSAEMTMETEVEIAVRIVGDMETETVETVMRDVTIVGDMETEIVKTVVETVVETDTRDAEVVVVVVAVVVTEETARIDVRERTDLSLTILHSLHSLETFHQTSLKMKLEISFMVVNARWQMFELSDIRIRAI